MDYLGRAQNDIDKRLSQGQNKSITSIGQGYHDALDANNKEFALYEPYKTTGLAALSGYTDAIGMNGEAGHDRAVESFRTSPGYEKQVEQATDAVARKASSLGVLGSGNTMAAITDRASDLADQEWDDHLDRLNGVVSLGYDATGRQAGVLSDRAGLYTQKGRDKADVYRGFTSMDVNSWQTTSGAIAEALHGGMMAGQNAAANRWNAGMSLAQLAAGFAGGDGFKNIKNLFA
jgi:hypothetical protein